MAAPQPNDPIAPLRLDGYLPYLINRAGVSLAARFSAALRAADVTLQDWRVLAALRERDGQRLTELAQRTSIEVSTLSRLVGGLEANGMVSRSRDSGDARAITIRLTVAGERVTATLTPAAQQLETAALAGLSEAEIAQLKSLLERIYGNLTTLPAAEDTTAK
ncbi:MarR family transcriptional regulator [Ferrovibrio terrae]|uniref:MarR family transcriptional regulator n=1 Tax=Ferrovibrio terrae TaxID=2594003 RepID=A0A516H1H9_9PROT|nr:MarR family transcriptional regulator [Ferrovibrio terrae]QDO97641.1 MarR family transcriptional regulator [Ferrovibrio terrae]